MEYINGEEYVHPDTGNKLYSKQIRTLLVIDYFYVMTPVSAHS
jgi:hypothetical protein